MKTTFSLAIEMLFNTIPIQTTHLPRIRFALMIICALITFNAPAQTPAHIIYDSEDGMTGTALYGLAQDKDGSIVFASSFGAYRFDGKSFMSIQDSTKGLASTDVILKMRTAPDGTPWCTPMQSGFSSIRHDLLIHEAQSQCVSIANRREIITNFYVDKQNTIYFAQRNHRFQIRTITAHGVLDSITCETDHGPGHFIHLVKIPGSGQHIGFHCRKEKRLEVIPTKKPVCRPTENGWLIDVTELEAFYGIRLYSNIFAFQSSTHLWFGSAGLILSRDLKTQKENLTLSKGQIVSIDSLSPHSVAISTLDGIFMSAPKSPSLDYVFPQKRFSGFIKDREGGAWASTLGDGLIYMPNLAIREFDLPMIQDRLVQWIGIEKGVGIAMCLSHQFLHVTGGIHNPTTHEYTVSDVSRLARIGRNQTLVGDELHLGNVKIDLSTGTPYPIKSADGSRIQFTGKWENEVVGLSSSGIQNLSTSKFWECPEGDLVRTCIVGKGDSIYIGTTSGIDVLDTRTGKYYSPGIPQLKGKSIRSIKSNSSDSFLIVADSAIFLLHGENIRSYSKSSGFANRYFQNTFWQSPDTFWVSSTVGVSRCILDSSGRIDILNIGRKDGLIPSFIRSIFHFNDTLYIPTERGVRMIDTRTLKPLDALPDPQIHSISISDSLLHTVNPVTLAADQRNISIDFSIISFKPGRQIEYAYMLEGFQTDWKITKEGFASYFNLPPGTYQFRAKARDVGGEWGNELAPLLVTVPAQFFETTFFWVALGTIIILMLSGLSFWFFRQRDKRRKTSWGYANAQLQALGLQMNPHFLFNALNSIQALAYGQHHEKVNTFVARLSGLIRTMLRHSDQPLIPLSVELDNLGMYLDMEQIRFENKPFQYNIEVDERIDLEHTQIPPMLLQPIAENALWHGLLKKEGDRALTVLCKSLDRGFSIQVRDNGIGYNPMKKTPTDRPSISLKNIQQRMELYDRLDYGRAHFMIQPLTSESGQSIGTEVTFTFNTKLE